MTQTTKNVAKARKAVEECRDKADGVWSIIEQSATGLIVLERNNGYGGRVFMYFKENTHSKSGKSTADFHLVTAAELDDFLEANGRE